MSTTTAPASKTAANLYCVLAYASAKREALREGVLERIATVLATGVAADGLADELASLREKARRWEEIAAAASTCLRERGCDPADMWAANEAVDSNAGFDPRAWLAKNGPRLLRHAENTPV